MTWACLYPLRPWYFMLACHFVWRAQPSLSAHGAHYPTHAYRTKPKDNSTHTYHGNHHCWSSEVPLNFSQTWNHSRFWCTRRWKHRHKSHPLAISPSPAEGRLFPPKFEPHQKQFQAKGLILLEDEQDDTPPPYLPLLFTTLLRSVRWQGVTWLATACQVHLYTCSKAHQKVCVDQT